MDDTVSLLTFKLEFYFYNRAELVFVLAFNLEQVLYLLIISCTALVLMHMFCSDCKTNQLTNITKAFRHAVADGGKANMFFFNKDKSGGWGKRKQVNV